MRNTIIFIVGPTSSGKSKAAVRLSEKINGEIISADSMQIYKGMDIINQAPESDLTLRVPHHLIRDLSPEDEYNAAIFVERSSELIDQIILKNKVPLITGGTGLYTRSLIDGIFACPPKDEALRKSLQELLSLKGEAYIYNKLQEIDPVTASKLHPHDTRRVVRALEVYELTGKTINEKKRETEGIAGKYSCIIFGLDVPRKKLYEKIDLSVENMFNAGLVAEVEKLKDIKLSVTAEKALGIREVTDYIEGKICLEEAKKELKKNTRRFAKRQLTWFRADDRIQWIDADRDVEEFVDEIAECLIRGDKK